MSAILSGFRGDTFEARLTLKDNLGVALDLTGATVFFTVKPEVDNDATDSTAVLKATVVSHSSPASGQTIITVPASETTLLTPDAELIYDIQVKFASGKIMTVCKDKFKVLGDVTRRTA